MSWMLGPVQSKEGISCADTSLKRSLTFCWALEKGFSNWLMLIVVVVMDFELRTHCLSYIIDSSCLNKLCYVHQNYSYILKMYLGT